MALDKSLTSGRRFGARYGRRVRHKFAKIEKEQKKGHTCPYCNADKVGRLAVGIWQCSKCNSKFTGKAYTITKKVVIKEEAPVEAVVAPEEMEAKEEEVHEDEKPQKYKEKRVEEPETQPDLMMEEEKPKKKAPKKKAEKKEEEE